MKPVRVFLAVLLTSAAYVGAKEESAASPVALQWKDVSLQLENKGKTRIILNGITGLARPGRMLAIMGPSGSGKSSLLHALAGQTEEGTSGLRLEGELVVNGEPVPDGRIADKANLAFVKQDDLFYAQMTVRETLLFAARLRLPRGVPLGEKEAIVDRLLDKLNLAKVANSVVGDTKVRGVSGGERKRLNIACELIGRPSLLFLDEPTSGLDSFQAQRLTRLLKQLSQEEGKTVVVVIHQPSAGVFGEFDDLLLLAEDGRPAYFGPADQAVSALSDALQQPAPPKGVAHAEYCLQQVSIDRETRVTREASYARLEKLTKAYRNSAAVKEIKQVPPPSMASSAGSEAKAEAEAKAEGEALGQGEAEAGAEGKGEAAGAALVWNASGEAAAARAPWFVRSLVRRKSEAWARARGLDVVDELAVLACKAQRLGKQVEGFDVPGGQGGGHDGTEPAVVVGRRAGFLEQFGLLFRRSWREVARGRLPLAIKVVQQVSTALIYGAIYNLDDSQVSIQERFGLLSLVTIGAANLGVATTIRSFPKEKQIVRSDRAKKAYDVAPYFLAKLVAEMPLSVLVSSLGGALLYPLVGFQRSSPKFLSFLGITALQALTASALGMLIGAAAPSSDAALAMFPPLVVLMVIFNGFNISEQSTPKLLKWLPKVSLINWGFRGLAINEFEGLTFAAPEGMPAWVQKSIQKEKESTDSSLDPQPQGRQPQRPAFVSTGEEALGRLALEKATVRGAVTSQARPEKGGTGQLPGHQTESYGKEAWVYLFAKVVASRALFESYPCPPPSQATLLGACYAGTYAVLRAQKPAFAKMKRPATIRIGF